MCRDNGQEVVSGERSRKRVAIAGYQRPTHSSMLTKNYHSARIEPSVPSSKPDIPPDRRWRISMTSMILAALIILSLGVGVANAQSFAHEMPPGTHHRTWN
jgi:hypothetical protein